MLRDVATPEGPEMVRALARKGLESRGVTQGWLPEVRTAQQNQRVGGFFKTHPERSADDAAAIDRAIAEPADQEGDLRDVAAVGARPTSSAQAGENAG